MKLPYSQLSLFVIGILLSILILFFVTENFLSSSGTEYRQHIFNCLVDDLKARNVTDDYFPSSSYDDISNVNCSEILKQFTIFEDLRDNLYDLYNETQNLCTEISKDKDLKPCDEEGSSNQSKSCNNMKETCADVKKHFEVDEVSQKKVLEELFYKQNKVNCICLSSCYDCIKGILLENFNYETTMLHAIAVNFTVIDFEVWNYFMISSKVRELVNEANEMVESAVNDCKIKKECVEISENWKTR